MARGRQAATTTVNLSPEDRALLRRMLMCLETIVGNEMPDPGEEFDVTEFDGVDLQQSTTSRIARATVSAAVPMS